MDSPSPQITTPTSTQKPSHDKLIGYILLIVGLLLIIGIAAFVFLTFTGQTNPPPVFNVKAPEIALPTQGLSINPDSLPPEIAKSINQTQTKPTSFKIIPDEVFSRLLNMSIFYMLAMFIASTGAKIASLGIQLIKDIKVNFKS